MDDFDIGDDGALAIDATPNLDSPTLSLPDSVDLTDGETTDDIAPLDNINGSSNVADPSQALLTQFSVGTAFGGVLDALTGGASGLGDELASLLPNEEPNQTQSSVVPTVLILGGAALLAFLVLK